MIAVAGEALIDLVIDHEGSVLAQPGGGPFNTARTIGRLGLAPTFLGRLSEDSFGRLLGASLDRDGVTLAVPQLADAPTTLAAVDVDPAGAPRYRFYLAGTSSSALEYWMLSAALPDGVTALHAGSLALVMEPIAASIERLIASDVPAGTLVMIDPNCRPEAIADPHAYRARLARIMRRADVVKVSVEDLGYLFPGTPAPTAAAALLDQGHKLILMTDGPRPAWALMPRHQVSVNVPAVQVVDTIGAGDAFGGAFLAWWSANQLTKTDLRKPGLVLQAVQAAAEVASLTCTRPGAEPPWLTELTGRPGWLLGPVPSQGAGPYGNGDPGSGASKATPWEIVSSGTVRRGMADAALSQPLNARTLAYWRGRLPTPAYDRALVTPGVVHIGVGGFHRAHQAMYLDRLMNQGTALDWGICGVGVMPEDERMKRALDAQDSLYTLVVKHGDGRYEPRVIGSLVEYLFAPYDPEAVIEKMAAEPTRIVSLTITEGGYNISDVTGEFDVANPDVIHDLQPGAVPRTTFGLITEALRRRRMRGIAPFTVMSCDNLPGNGDLSKRVITDFARLRDKELGDWVGREVRFPNSMVDRITPATTGADRAEIRERFGIDDRWPVVCEPYTQWVLQDAFAAGRPPYEQAGVQVVDQVEPYELMKLRLLNGSHQAMCYFAYLSGYRLVHEAARDPLFRAFLRGYIDAEATPTLAPVPGVDLGGYKRTLIERFSNPQIHDTIARLCEQSSDRIPKFLLPVIRHQLATGGEIRRSAAVVASWARYAEGIDEQGEPIEVVDRLADSLMQLARHQREDPDAFIANRDLFGDLADQERFAGAFRRALESLHQRGARATLESLI